MCHQLGDYKSLDLSFSYVWCSSKSVPDSSVLPTSAVDCKGERANLAIVWKTVVWIIVEQMAVEEGQIVDTGL